MRKQSNSVLANGENLAVVTGEANVSNNSTFISAKAEKDGATMTTNNNNSARDFAFFSKVNIDRSDLFVNEPVSLSEGEERTPIRDAMVGQFRFRVWDDLFAMIGEYSDGKFVKSFRTYEQIVGLLSGLEIMANPTGTIEHGVHSRYDVKSVSKTGDLIKEFAVIRFSAMSDEWKAWFASKGIVDDGEHEDRWTILSAEKGKFKFNHQIHPRVSKEFVAFMKETYSEEARQISLERDGKERRVVTEYKDITKFDWNKNNQAWAQTNLHDAFDYLLNVLDGSQVLRIAPQFYQKANKAGEIVGLSAQEKAQYIAERYIKMFGGAEELLANRKQRKADGKARREITGMTHVLANPEKYGMELNSDVAEAVASGKAKVFKGSKVRVTKLETLVSELNGKTIWLAASYRNGDQPRAGKFAVYSMEELVGALQKASNAGLVVKVL